MAGYIGTKAVALSTTTGNILGDMTVGGTTDVATLEFNSLSGTGAVTITDILDEDNLASNSATKLATQQSIKAYVDAQVDTVDTLAEILAVGNRTSGTGKIEFRDANLFINSSTSGQLDIAANTEIELTATTVDVQGNFTNSGTIVSTGKITADAGIDIDNFNIDGTTIALSSGDLTIDVAGDINLDSDSGYVLFKDGGTEHARIFQNNSGDVNISSQISDKDMKFLGNDGGVGFTALTLDMSAEGNAHFNRSIGVGFPALPTGSNFDSIRLGGAGFFMSNSNTNASGINAMVHNGQYDADNSWEYIATDEAEYYYQSAGSHRFLSAPSGTAGNDITFVDRVEFEADGDVRIYDGNLVVASGHGINFSANTNINSGATSELFECYEHGFYTATMTPSTSGSVTLSSGVDTLSYTKIGQIVHIQGLLETSGKSSPVGSQLRVTLPVAIIDSSEYSGRVGGGIMFNNGNGAAPTVIPFSGVEGGTVVNFIMDASTVHPGGSPSYSQWYIDFSYTAA